MNAQDLKNSILQLAIQGKLVKQRKEEGTAKELLENIEAKKKQLIKEGKIKKEKKLPEITDNEVLFDIPESWLWTRISNIADMYTGNSISKSAKEIKYSKGKDGYDYIGTKDVNFDYTIDYDNGIKIPFEEEKFRKSFKDSVLMCIEGGSAGRKIGILDKTVCFGNKLCSFNLIYGEPRFLYYYLQSPIFFQTFRDEMSGIIGGVGITKIKSIVIPLPPLEEQKRIVAKIEELIPYVDKYDLAYSEVEKLNKKFPEDMQKSILQYAIQGKLVEQREEDGTAEELYTQFQEEKKKMIKEGTIKNTKELPEITEQEIPFDIPENWKWVYLNDISFVTKLAGFEYTKHLANAILPQGEIPIVRAKNIKPNKFMENEEEFITTELSEKLSRCALDTRCVLMTFIGAGIGESAIFENHRRNHLAPNVAKIVPYLDINNYLLYYLMSYSGRREIFKFMKRTAQPSLSMETIRKIIVPLPPLEVQKRIVEKIEELLPFAKQLVK